MSSTSKNVQTSQLLRLLGFGFLCVLIQSNLFLQQYLFSIKPDLTIPLTVYIGLRQDPLWGGLLVVCIAYLMDVASGGVLGLYVFLRVTMLVVIHMLKNRFFFENRLFYCAVVMVLFLMESVFIYALFHFLGKNVGSLPHLLTTSLYQGALTLVLWILLLSIFLKLKTAVGKPRGL